MYAAFVAGYYSWHKHLRLSHCAVEVPHRCSFALFCVLRWVFLAPTLHRLFCSHVLWWWQYPPVFQSLLRPLVMLQSSRVYSSTLSLVSVVGAAGRPMRGLSPVPFSSLLKRRAQCLSVYGILTIHASLTSVSIQQKIHSPLSVQYVRQQHVILHGHCTERMWLTWLRQGTPPGATFERKK